MTQAEFISSVKTKTPEAFFNDHIMVEESKYIKSDQIEFIKNTIATRMSINTTDIKIIIAGSSKLEYSLYEKRENGRVLPKYRPFSIFTSDIDVAVISTVLFEKCWDTLSNYACLQPTMPWDGDELSDYLLSGWIRPEKLPDLIFYRMWWDCFGFLSRQPRLGKLKVRGCLYYKFDYFKNYQIRSITNCVRR